MDHGRRMAKQLHMTYSPGYTHTFENRVLKEDNLMT